MLAWSLAQLLERGGVISWLYSVDIGELGLSMFGYNLVLFGV